MLARQAGMQVFRKKVFPILQQDALSDEQVAIGDALIQTFSEKINYKICPQEANRKIGQGIIVQKSKDQVSVQIPSDIKIGEIPLLAKKLQECLQTEGREGRIIEPFIQSLRLMRRGILSEYKKITEKSIISPKEKKDLFKIIIEQAKKKGYTIDQEHIAAASSPRSHAANKQTVSIPNPFSHFKVQAEGVDDLEWNAERLPLIHEMLLFRYGLIEMRNQATNFTTSNRRDKRNMPGLIWRKSPNNLEGRKQHITQIRDVKRQKGKIAGLNQTNKDNLEEELKSILYPFLDRIREYPHHNKQRKIISMQQEKELQCMTISILISIYLEKEQGIKAFITTRRRHAAVGIRINGHVYLIDIAKKREQRVQKVKNIGVIEAEKGELQYHKVETTEPHQEEEAGMLWGNMDDLYLSGATHWLSTQQKERRDMYQMSRHAMSYSEFSASPKIQNCMVLIGSGLFDEALKAVDVILELNPQNSFVHILKSRILLAQNKNNQSIKAAEDALSTYLLEHHHARNRLIIAIIKNLRKGYPNNREFQTIEKYCLENEEKKRKKEKVEGIITTITQEIYDKKMKRYKKIARLLKTKEKNLSREG